MLNVRVFGTAPVPAWAQDQAAMQARGAYRGLIKRARQRALNTEPPDLQAPVAIEPLGELPEDAPWPSALGLFSVADVQVFPLCRPSHLAAVGEFFQNCLVPDNRLGVYVNSARQGSMRFFRLERGDTQALLALACDGGAWEMQTVLGRFNQDVDPSLRAAAERVSALYAVVCTGVELPQPVATDRALDVFGFEHVSQDP